MARPTKMESLRSAVDNHDLVGVRCDYCRIKRNYHPKDLLEICGDIAVERLDRVIRCERCGEKKHISAFTWKPIGVEEKLGTIVRRIRKRMVRKIEWRDEPFTEDGVPAAEQHATNTYAKARSG